MTSWSVAADVLVVGAGPAGHAAAAACAGAGLDTVLLAPDPVARWPQTYGAWLDELEPLDLAGVATRRWTDTRVRTGDGGELRPVDRTYCLIDNERLRDLLWARASAAGARRIAARAVAIGGGAGPARAAGNGDTRAGDHGGVVAVVHTADGTRYGARAVVDASGQPPALTRRRHGALAYQTAYGLVATFERAPAPPGSACLMDFDAAPFGGADAAAPGRGATADDPGAPATFLYALDLGAGRWLVEETCLAARPGAPLARLEARLHTRLAARGCTPLQVHATERVAFPMDPPLPPSGTGVCAFGAAAALTHPATGYQVATALRRAPLLAGALRAALSDPGASAVAVADAALAAVWPAALRRQHALYRMGLEVLLRLDVAATQRFFAAFFGLPAPAWRGYLSWTSTPVGLAATMLTLMRALPPDVRAEVLRAATRRPALRWLGAAALPAAAPRRAG